MQVAVVAEGVPEEAGAVLGAEEALVVEGVVEAGTEVASEVEAGGVVSVVAAEEEAGFEQNVQSCLRSVSELRLSWGRLSVTACMHLHSWQNLVHVLRLL